MEKITTFKINFFKHVRCQSETKMIPQILDFSGIVVFDGYGSVWNSPGQVV